MMVVLWKFNRAEKFLLIYDIMTFVDVMVPCITCVCHHQPPVLLGYKSVAHVIKCSALIVDNGK